MTRTSVTNDDAGTSVLQRAWRSLRDAWATQEHLHQVYLDRHEVSGRDAVRATRTLRWSGDCLVGDLLPGQTPSQ
jgi:hypothetical protein